MIEEVDIDEMIASGRKIVDTAIAEYKPIAIIGAFSGGNDSIVSTHFAVSQYSAVVLHCDTSIGIPLTRDHVDAVAERFKWDMRVFRAKTEPKPGRLDIATLPSGQWIETETPYEQFVINFGFPGPSQHGRMYQRLKGRPIADFQRELKRGGRRTDFILIISGIRSDESAIRAGYKRDTQREGTSSRVWVNPFYWHTAADFEAYRDEFGLPRNPVKARIGVSGECNCGAFAGNAEKEAIRLVDPIFAAYLDGLEDRVKANGYPWGWGQVPPKWWMQGQRGQGFLFDSHDGMEDFRPMCVGCKLRR